MGNAQPKVGVSEELNDVTMLQAGPSDPQFLIHRFFKLIISFGFIQVTTVCFAVLFAGCLVRLSAGFL